MRKRSALALLALCMTEWRLVAAGGDPQSHFAQLDSLKVHYTIRGSGSEALVFVHGWSCDSTF